MLLTIFVAIELRSPNPLLPLRVLKDRRRSGASLAVLLVGIRLFGVFLLLTRADAGVASALVNTSQQVGGSVGTALLNTLATTATAGFARQITTIRRGDITRVLLILHTVGHRFASELEKGP